MVIFAQNNTINIRAFGLKKVLLYNTLKYEMVRGNSITYFLDPHRINGVGNISFHVAGFQIS